MKLVEIRIKNWKCFSDKVVEFSNEITMLKWPNGSGKSSLIEAIIFALFGKRPNGLDFDSLRKDLSQNCEIVLKLNHSLNEYVVERSFGSSSSHRLYKNGELIARTANDVKKVMDSIIPEFVITSLWGYNSLAQSNVLKTEYLFELLESEFEEPLKISKHFQTIRTINQKQISTLEKTIKNQDIAQKDLDQLDSEIEEIEDRIKEKAFVSDSQVVQAKRAESVYHQYQELSSKLSQMSYVYERDLCLRLVKYKIKSSQEWDLYFQNIENQLELEKMKATKLHPLAKYPKHTIDAILKDCELNHTCVICNSNYTPIQINYDKIDTKKIHELETILEDRKYNFQDLNKSIQYFQTKKQLEDLHYDESFDWKSILDQYNKETNLLYDTLKKKRSERELLKSDLGKIADLLTFRKKYDEAKECISIAKEYIDQAKQYYADSLTKTATTILNKLNSRYDCIYIEDGIYKVVVSDPSFTTQSRLAVQALSMGEKTLVSLSLILAVRDLIVKDIPLVMDEAFSNLDAYNVEAINRLLMDDTSQWIIVSHDERLFHS